MHTVKTRFTGITVYNHTPTLGHKLVTLGPTHRKQTVCSVSYHGEFYWSCSTLMGRCLIA